jgi:hypothetical protein
MGARILGIAKVESLCCMSFRRICAASLSMSGFWHSDGKTKKRHAKQKPCSHVYHSRTLWNPANMVRSAKALSLGTWFLVALAVTHPHAKSETHCHAAI